MRFLKAIALAGGVSAMAIGCGRKEEAAPPPPAAQPSQPATAPAQNAVAAVKQTVENTVTEAKKVAESAQQAVQKTVDDSTSQVQGLIDGAKAMVSEKKYSDALGAVQQLAGVKLNPEQLTLVEGLKVEVAKLGGDIEKGMANLKTVANQQDYTQGLSLVKQLASYQLTPEQQKVVDGLKAELQKAVGGKTADEAKKALGNVLGGNK
jgi:hypothetical protein